MKIIYQKEQFAKTVDMLAEKSNLSKAAFSVVLTKTIKELVRSSESNVATLGFFLNKNYSKDEDIFYIEIYVDASFGIKDTSFIEDNISDSFIFN